MKTIFKILTVIIVLTLTSCTDNEEIVTKNGKIINIQSVDKGDVIAPGSGGGYKPVDDYDE